MTSVSFIRFSIEWNITVPCLFVLKIKNACSIGNSYIFFWWLWHCSVNYKDFLIPILYSCSVKPGVVLHSVLCTMTSWQGHSPSSVTPVSDPGMCFCQSSSHFLLLCLCHKYLHRNVQASTCTHKRTCLLCSFISLCVARRQPCNHRDLVFTPRTVQQHVFFKVLL